MSVPEYTAGDWTAVVRPGFVALLGPGAAESTVRALWQDAGEGVFAALALLARDGFGGCRRSRSCPSTGGGCTRPCAVTSRSSSRWAVGRTCGARAR